MEELRILFLCPQPLWPVNTGARLRNFHLADALGASCKITVLQIISPTESNVPQTEGRFQQVISAVRSRSYSPGKILRGLAGPLPITVLNYTSEGVEQALAKALDDAPFDAVQMESIHLFHYFETIRRARDSPVVVLDWHNIESELMQRYGEAASNPAKKLIAARTAQLLRRLEDRALEMFSAHTVVSEREKEKLLRRVPGAQIHVIPNGVDTASFSHSDEGKLSSPERKTLLFVGSMDYHANSDGVLRFCRDIWPLLAAEFPSLDFKIVGRNPPASIRALASSRITITGTVDDVRPYYRQSFAVLVPLRVGGGTRLKILEAMAAGVPVISTRLGAEGIAVEDHRNILLADTAKDMASSIRILIGQPEFAVKIRAAARDLVTSRYDWSVLGRQLVDVYANSRR